MKVVQITPSDELLDRRDYRDYVSIEVDDKEVFRIGAGEPEDMYISRDLSDALVVVNLMEQAYLCGKRGDDFTISYQEDI